MHQHDMKIGLSHVRNIEMNWRISDVKLGQIVVLEFQLSDHSFMG